MTPTEILTAICPGLAADANLGTFLQLATQLTSSSYFGNQYSYAVALRAAHQWTLSKRLSGGGGNITSMTEGGLSISFSSGTGKINNSDLGQTSYGVQLNELINSISPAIAVLGADDEVVDISTTSSYS